MTDQERKAMEMALNLVDALEGNKTITKYGADTLRQALAQGEQTKPSDFLVETYSVELGSWSVTPDRGVKITHVPTGTVVSCDSEHSQHANKRLAMQKLKAALAQPEQAPVAWIGSAGIYYGKNKYAAIPLYTAPQSKPWVSLTDEEVEDICWTSPDSRLWAFAEAIEAKLKERNT